MKKHVGLALISALSVASPLAGAAAATEAVLYQFTGGGGFADGNNASRPVGSLIEDATGALFGVTNNGGHGCGSNGPGCGTVFRIAPPVAGKTSWRLAFLTSFMDGPGGSYPAAGLLMGPDGALYGTASGGGTGVSSSGGGIVFKLAPPPAGGATSAWTRTTLYRFMGGSDGATPLARLSMDADGALYGTTASGGINNNGTVFKLAPPPHGKKAWAETVLYRFAGDPDGARPLGGVLMGAGGVLFGTTSVGGNTGQGTVYALSPPASGATAWSEAVLYGFNGGDDGAFPQYVDLAADADGALYGTTIAGGAANLGSVFKLVPPASGKTVWTERLLHRFKGTGDGANPNTGVVLDAQGALYGTTTTGGAANLGVAYKLAQLAGELGSTETVLHGFAGGADGATPWAGVTLAAGGAVFGTTMLGGGGCPNQSADGCGTVFEITP